MADSVVRPTRIFLDTNHLHTLAESHANNEKRFSALIAKLHAGRLSLIVDRYHQRHELLRANRLQTRQRIKQLFSHVRVVLGHPDIVSCINTEYLTSIGVHDCPELLSQSFHDPWLVWAVRHSPGLQQGYAEQSARAGLGPTAFGTPIPGYDTFADDLRRALEHLPAEPEYLQMRESWIQFSADVRTNRNVFARDPDAWITSKCETDTLTIQIAESYGLEHRGWEINPGSAPITCTWRDTTMRVLNQHDRDIRANDFEDLCYTQYWQIADYAVLESFMAEMARQQGFEANVLRNLDELQDRLTEEC